MSEVHVSGGHTRSAGAFIVELVMISLAVFLGLLADQWREARHNRELAQTALRNFRAEIITNQGKVNGVREYHQKLQKSLGVFLQNEKPRTLKEFSAELHFNGIKPVTFEHTAWDLSLATQALGNIDPDLAFEISKVYTRQTTFERIEFAFAQSAFTPQSISGDIRGLAIAMIEYLGDVTVEEPSLLKQYATLIPQINLALGDSATSASTKKD